MAKSIIKEIIIMLLLTLAIIIVLGLVLYEYVPMSKVVPEPVSYTTPSEVKEELMKAGEIDESEVIMTYEVDSTDLSNYRRTSNYNPGKANPFSSYETQEENATNTTSTSGTSNQASSGSTTSAGQSGTTSGTSTTAEGKFFQDKGTK